MKTGKYYAKQPDAEGFVDYSDEENTVWSTLYQRQIPLIQKYACDDYLQGFERLGLSASSVPQLPDVNKVLQQSTGWSVVPVAAVIPFGEFFELLSNKQFPAATFIRTQDDIEYLQEPDIFHEIFGHCPLLTNQTFADFSEAYGKLGVKATQRERIFLARIFWFTVEFGLIDTAQGSKIYGAGILSSKGECEYALDSSIPERRLFETKTILRTPYRIDIFQTIYYVIKQFKDIYNVMNDSIMPLIHEAMELGNFPPSYPPKNSPQTIVKTNADSHPC